jgi:mannose-6-phosphate isomerase-like protein (cupin superfamily)
MHPTPLPVGEGSLASLDSARANEAFRRVLRTGPYLQVVAMTIPPDGDIGVEVHPDTDQLFLVVEGRGEAELDGRTQALAAGDILLVTAGTRHDITTRGEIPLRLITVYAPPHHAPNTVHRTRAEAEAAED